MMAVVVVVAVDEDDPWDRSALARSGSQMSARWEICLLHSYMLAHIIAIAARLSAVE